jgi:shikimate kinase
LEGLNIKIILVGVSCVGKSTVGIALADDIGFEFFDFDDEIEKYFNKPISFLKREFVTEHNYRQQTSVVLQKILDETMIILFLQWYQVD